MDKTTELESSRVPESLKLITSNEIRSYMGGVEVNQMNQFIQKYHEYEPSVVNCNKFISWGNMVLTFSQNRILCFGNHSLVVFD